jgi:hypothetical protein
LLARRFRTALARSADFVKTMWTKKIHVHGSGRTQSGSITGNEIDSLKIRMQHRPGRASTRIMSASISTRGRKVA